MAAFASFHIGEKIQLWNWEQSAIKTFSDTCQKKSKSLEDDFQIIRIINNKIFSAIGTMHLGFSQLPYSEFKNQLIFTNKNELLIQAFDKLNAARTSLHNGTCTDDVKELIWEANVDILWHEQHKVVQPLFDKLTFVFSGAMSLIASFDYDVNHKKTDWKLASRFVFFMLTKGLKKLTKHSLLPDVTDLEQRWYWISQSLLKKWQKVENNREMLAEELQILAHLEDRKLTLNTVNTP